MFAVKILQRLASTGANRFIAKVKLAVRIGVLSFHRCNVKLPIQRLLIGPAMGNHADS